MGNVPSVSSYSRAPTSVDDYFCKDTMSRYINIYQDNKNKLNNQNLISDFYNSALEKISKSNTNTITNNKEDAKQLIKDILELLKIEFENINTYTNVFCEVDKDIEGTIEETKFLPLCNNLNTFSFPYNGKTALQNYIKENGYSDFSIQIIISLLESLIKDVDFKLLIESLGNFYNEILTALINGQNTHKLIQILITIFDKHHICYVIFLFIEALHENTALSNIISQNISSLKPIVLDPQESRVRFGISSKIKSICCGDKYIYLLTAENKIFVIKDNKIISKQFDQASVIFLSNDYKTLYLATNKKIILLDKSLNSTKEHDILESKVILACEVEESFLFLAFEDKRYILSLNDQIFTPVLPIDQKPVFMYYHNKILTIITKDKEYLFSLNMNTRYFRPNDERDLTDKNIVAMDNTYYLIHNSGRSYHEFIFKKQEQNIPYDSFDFENNNTDCISRLTNYLSINGPATHPEMIKPLIRIISQACNSGVTPQISAIVAHRCFKFLLMVLDDFPDSIKISDYLDILMTITKSSLSTRQHIMSIIIYAIGHNFELISDHTDQIIEIFHFICKDSIRVKLLYYVMGILIDSPALVYAVHFSSFLENFSKTEKPNRFIFPVLYYGIKYSNKLNDEIVDTVANWGIPSKYSYGYHTHQIFIANYVFALIRKFKAIKFVQRYLPVIQKYIPDFIEMGVISSKEDRGDFLEEVIERETSHPLKARTNVRWEVSMPGAEAIKIEFSNDCAIMLSEHDSFLVMNENETIYSRNMYSEGKLPSVLISNGSKVTVSLRQFCGTRVYGLSLKFIRIGQKKEKRLQSGLYFFSTYLMHSISQCCIDIFADQNEDNDLKPCDFLSDHHMLDQTMTLTPKYVPLAFMNAMYSEFHPTMKTTQEDMNIERAVVSAVLWQLNLTNIAIRKKSSIVIQPPSIPKDNSMTPARPNFQKTMNHIPPMISPFAQTPIRASVNPKSLAPLLQKKENESLEIDDILKYIMKEVYKLRSRIRYSKQKCENETNFVYQIIEKANYFCGIRPVFDDLIPPTLEVKKQRAANLIRLFGSFVKLDKVISYTNDMIQRKKAQYQVSSFINNLLKSETFYKEIFYLVIPFINHIATTKRKFSKEVTKNIQEILNSAFQFEDNNIQLLSVLSDINLMRDKEEDHSKIINAFMEMDHSMLWNLSLMIYFMSIPNSFLIGSMNDLMTKGMSDVVFLLFRLLSIDEKTRSTVLNEAYNTFARGSPKEIISAIRFVTKAFPEVGVKKETKINQSLSIYDWLQCLIIDVGNYVMKKDLKSIKKGFPKECYDVIIGEIVSMIRTLLLDNRSSNDILVLMDDILYNTKLNMAHQVSVYGVYMIIGHGIYPLTVGFGVNDKFKNPLKVTEFIPDTEFVGVDTADGLHINIREDKIYGSPEVAFSTKMYPFTKFRLTTLMLGISISAIDPVLYALTSLTMASLAQDKTWRDEIKLTVDSTVIADAVVETNEAFYHSMGELIQSAASADFKEEKLTHLVRINPNVQIGNCPVSGQFKFEIVYNSSIYAVGILGENASTEYTPVVFLEFCERSVFINGIRSFYFSTDIRSGDIIALEINDNNDVTFYRNGELLVCKSNEADICSVTFPHFKYVPFVQSTLDQEIHICTKFDKCFQVQKYVENIPLYDAVIFNSDDIDDGQFQNTVKSGIVSNIKRFTEDSLDAINPYVFKRKLLVTSKIENISCLKLIYGHYCRVNIKSSRFYNKVGRIIEIDSPYVDLEFVDIMEGKKLTEKFESCFVTPISTFITKLQVTKDIFKVIGIRAMRLALLEIGYVSQFKRYIKNFIRLMIPSVIKAFGETRIKEPDICEFIPISSNRHYARCLVDIINDHMEILTEEGEKFPVYSNYNYYVGTDSVCKNEYTDRIQIDHTTKAIGAVKWICYEYCIDNFHSNIPICVTGVDDSFSIRDSNEKSIALNGDTIELKYLSFIGIFYQYSKIDVSLCPLYEYNTYMANDLSSLNNVLSFCNFYSLLNNEAEYNKEIAERCSLIINFAREFTKIIIKTRYQTTMLLVEALYKLASNKPKNFFFYCNHLLEKVYIPEVETSKGLFCIRNSIAYPDRIFSFDANEKYNFIYLMMASNIWNGIIGNTLISNIWYVFLNGGCYEDLFFTNETSFEDSYFTFFPNISVSYRFAHNLKCDYVEFKLNGVIIPPNTPISIETNRMDVEMVSKTGEALPDTFLTFALDKDPFNSNGPFDDEGSGSLPNELSNRIKEQWGKDIIRKGIKNHKSTDTNNISDQLLLYSIAIIKELQEVPIKQCIHKYSMRPFILGSLHAFDPDIQAKIIDKIACKMMGSKPILQFSRTAAALMLESPRPSHACSLFDQLIKQVKISELRNMKARNAPFTVELAGEGAIDAGGPGRDLFSEIREEIFKDFNHLFVQTVNYLFVPDPRVDPSRFVYVGALVGLSFITQNAQPFQFDNIVWRFLIGEKPTISDILNSDEAFSRLYSSEDERPMVCPSVTGEQRELVPGGRDISTSADEWRRKAEEFRLSELRLQLKAFRYGFELIMEKTCRWLAEPEQLQLLICGPSEVSEEELIQCLNFTDVSDAIKENFPACIRKLTPKERPQILKFITGRVTLPVDSKEAGFRINVAMTDAGQPPYLLPVAATCASTITIPDYPNADIMLERIRMAFSLGSEMIMDGQFNAADRTT